MMKYDHDWKPLSLGLGSIFLKLLDILIRVPVLELSPFSFFWWTRTDFSAFLLQVSDPTRAALGYDQSADLWSLGVVLRPGADMERPLGNRCNNGWWCNRLCLNLHHMFMCDYVFSFSIFNVVCSILHDYTIGEPAIVWSLRWSQRWGRRHQGMWCLLAGTAWGDGRDDSIQLVTNMTRTSENSSCVSIYAILYMMFICAS